MLLTMQLEYTRRKLIRNLTTIRKVLLAIPPIHQMKLTENTREQETSLPESGILLTTDFEDEKKSKPFKCIHCNDTFAEKQDLLTHTQDFHDKQACGYCMEEFNGRISLDKHMNDMCLELVSYIVDDHGNSEHEKNPSKSHTHYPASGNIYQIWVTGL